tara:strand:+ start:959 stop:1939 length:981 start_codon:yes stop_codon:yes gene_type:complete
MSIQIIWGNDTKSCENEIEKIIKSNISKEWEAFNLSKFDGNDENQVFNALEEVQNAPFGDGSRIILLKNNPIFSIKNEKFATKFESSSLNIHDSTILILFCRNKPDARINTTKFLKKLIKSKKAFESSYILPDIWDYESQLKYVKEFSRAYSIKIDENATKALIETIGTESTNLDNELRKACLYLSAKKLNLLTVKDIELLFFEQQSNIFKIIDSLIEKKISQSLTDINILINQGEPPLRLIAGIISQIRIHTIVSLLSEENDLSKISELADIKNPKRIFFIRKKIKNCDPKFLINLMIKLLDIEFFVKRGMNPLNVFTEHLASLT